MKKIISISRRSDVIAQSYDWLKNCFLEEKVTLQNPYFKNKKYTVSLKKENIHSIVLWSKDFTNFVRNPSFLLDYSLFFQYTMNLYPKNIEKSPSLKHSLTNLKWMIDNYGMDRITLRFDPVFFIHNNEKEIALQERLDSFEKLVNEIKKITNENIKIVTSYITLNKNIERQFKVNNIVLLSLTDNEVTNFFIKMKKIADNRNVQLLSCADKRLLDSGLSLSKCIDGEYISKITGEKVSLAKDNAQRKDCLCTKSVDIGIYPFLDGGKKCFHQCTYCYVKKKYYNIVKNQFNTL